MDINFNRDNQLSIQQIITNSNFAQFLSEHLSHNNVSQSEITNLLNIFSSQLNNQQNQNNSLQNTNQMINNSDISGISIDSNNNSIISDSHILSDVSEAPIINNNKEAAPELKNFMKKEYANGTFEGQIINGKRNGKGIMNYKTGDVYQGEYLNDRKEGMGIYISIDGYKYEGEFKKGLRDGKGKIKYKNGDKYDGMWKSDKYSP